MKLSYYRIFMIICNSFLNVKLSRCLLDDVFVVLRVSNVFLIVRRSLFHRFSEHSTLLPRSRHDTVVEFPERKTWSFRPALKKWTTRTIKNMIETRRTTSTLHHHSAIIMYIIMYKYEMYKYGFTLLVDIQFKRRDATATPCLRSRRWLSTLSGAAGVRNSRRAGTGVLGVAGVAQAGEQYSS